MSTPTISRENFDVLSDVNKFTSRDYPVKDKTLLDGRNANALVEGEWVTFDGSASILKLVRGTNIANVGERATTVCFPVVSPLGSWDSQAASQGKKPIIIMGQYEFFTRIFDASNGAASGATPAFTPITRILQPVTVATIKATFSGAVRGFSGLVGVDENYTGPIVGYVTGLPAHNGGKLRVVFGWAIRNGCAPVAPPVVVPDP